MISSPFPFPHLVYIDALRFCQRMPSFCAFNLGDTFQNVVSHSKKFYFVLFTFLDVNGSSCQLG